MTRYTNKIRNYQNSMLNSKLNKPGTAEEGPFRMFQHALLQNIKKLKGDLLVNFLTKKSQSVDKTERGTL